MDFHICGNIVHDSIESKSCCCQDQSFVTREHCEIIHEPFHNHLQILYSPEVALPCTHILADSQLEPLFRIFTKFSEMDQYATYAN